ncbi:MAG: glycosyltransferase family 2 protein [Bacteroidota bacterium]|nr:glycosyltransferase family 2 protein [Bacteroidota bacterium]
MKQNIKIIIPAFNEENAIGKVINDIPKNFANEIIVVNNASTDKTASIAKSAGATVLTESKKGYGKACLTGINYIKNLKEPIDIIIFIDADYSDFPEEMPILIGPIITNNKDLVIGSRALGNRAAGSMTFPQLFGNWLATYLLKIFYKVEYTDLGPFRAIKWDKLLQLNMQDKTFGWTVEMQLKAAKLKFKTAEVPVTYRKRVGISKISGTITGTIMAGYKIIWTIFKYL